MAATVGFEGHIRKRQFQPSINSYFHHSRDAPSSSAPERARSPMSSPLPEETQASLLSVGMRVRKSVPEGYKTHKTIGMEQYPFPSAAPVRKMERAQSQLPTKELMPFCGLHKVGGWGAQEVPPSSAPAILGDESDDDMDMPGMTTSQSTLLSIQGSFGSNTPAFAAKSRKRTYEDEVEEDLDAYFDGFRDEPAAAPVDRPIARMRQQAKGNGGVPTVRVAGVDDFEDAIFLTPSDGMDIDDA